MPMASASGKLWITYNGEIYNYRELRKELQGYGYHFRSNTDTEVALYAYDKWGPDCLGRFNGMFALAIWDEEDQRLFLARDRLGIKPLYYYFDTASIIFASEIKAILQDPAVSKELAPEGILNYFTFGHSMAPHTIFKNIRKLLPGHYMLCFPEGTRLRSEIRRYWAPPLPGHSEDAGEEYYCEEIRRLLGESVRKQLISDVPLGVFLSGGLDSSIITGLMSSLHQSRVKTFSVGFSIGGKAYNELDDARLVARHFGTEHEEILLDENDLTQALPNLVYHYDEPFGDAASFPTYLLSKFARKSITVSLSGEGGDEVFGGYRRYVVENFLARYPVSLALLANGTVRKTLSHLPMSGRWQKLMDVLGAPDAAERYARWLTIFSPDMRAELFGEKLAQLEDFDPLDLYRRLYPRNGTQPVDRLLYVDQQTWLPDTYLEKADKASMAASLEVRVPFLDHELVEFAATIPAKYKVSGFSTKHILKKAFASQLPDRTLRKPKHGFAVPLDYWFVDKFGTLVQEILFDNKARSRGLFNQDYVKRLFRWHTEGRGHYHRQLWLLIVFELWCQKILDHDNSAVAITRC